MTTISLSAGQVSAITFVPAGSRINSNGNGSIEWTPGTPTDAANSPNWQTWAKESSAGLRPMSIRATATGAMTVTIEEGRGDKYGEDAYFDTDYPTLSNVSGSTVLVGAGGAKLRIGGDQVGTPVVLYDGDSITARAKSADLPSVEGGSNAFSGYNANCYVTWERAELGNVYSFVNNAVSGETIEQITARLLATDISGYAVVSLMCGTNNISAAADVAGDIALIEDVCQYCLEQNKPLRISTIIPLGGTPTADQLAYILAFNTAIKKLPQTYSNVFVGDGFLGIQDTTAANPTAIAGGLFGDNTHPTKYGSFRISKYGAKDAMYDALRYAGYGSTLDAKRMWQDGETYTELLTNTDFATQTGGTNSLAGGLLTVGAVPSGWRIDELATPTNVKIYYPFYVAEAKRQRGIWVTGRVYAVDDTVTDSGAAYLCTAAHTAGATFAGDAANWKRVWSTEYCWQVEFTADAANDGVNIFRSSVLSTIAATDEVQGFCGVAVEGDVGKIMGGTTGMFQIEAYGTTYGHFNGATYNANGGTEATVGERFEGVFETTRQAFFSGGGTIGSQQFRIQVRLNAAGTASIIIYKPSLRKYA